MRFAPLSLLLIASPALADRGSLVIVGGGLSKDNAAIYRAFIDRVPAGKTIAIVPSASGEPLLSAQEFAHNLMHHGFDSRRISIVHLAEKDDPNTRLVYEDQWAVNGKNRTEIAKINRAGGIWFTGGDQARTMRVLAGTPMLKVMRKRLKSGAVIGGTSAGAAIMGDGMILCGDPALADVSAEVSRDPKDCAPQEGQPEPLVVGPGLGFLPGFIVDQHFTQRKRQPRLQRAVRAMRDVRGFGMKGVGIDEDTALVLDFKASAVAVVGRGTILLMQTKADAQLLKPEDRLSSPLLQGP
jgi:cyanophycinase